MVGGAKWAESWADFFGSFFSRFGSVLESLMLVCDFLLSSPTVGYVDSDSASLSFWKNSGEKIERDLGRTHGHEKIGNFWKFEKIAEIWFWKLISLAFSNCGIEMIAVANFQMLRTRKIAQKLDFWSLVNPKICLGPALRAIFRFSAKLALKFVMIYICNTYSIWLVETVS